MAVMKCKAVIFDLDGTLVNTLEDIAESVNQALEKQGLPKHSTDSFRMRVGHGNRVMVSRSLPADRQELVDNVLSMQLDYYADHLCDHSRPYPDVPEMLAALKEKGHKLGVLSNKPDEFTRRIVDTFFSQNLFNAVAGNSAGQPLKPDPTGALTLADQLDASAADTVFVGDTAIDMATAVRAGMYPLGVAWGFRGRLELVQGGARAIIDRPFQLPILLDL